MEITCPSCHVPVPSAENFCPRCGANLKDQGLSTSIGRQAFIYLFSFFLAPVGLVFVLRYLKQPNPEARRVGIIALVITIIAVGLMIWLTYAFTSWQYKALNEALM